MEAELTTLVAPDNTLRLERLFSFIRKIDRDMAGKNLTAPLEITMRWTNGELQRVPVKVPEMID